MSKRSVVHFFITQLSNIKAWLWYVRCYLSFRRMNRIDGRFQVKWKNRLPCLHDRGMAVGFDRHYLYHTGWACRILAATKPARHIDISSSLYFVVCASAFVPLDHYDFNPPPLTLDGLVVKSANLISLPFGNNSISSLSCMHVLEHVGLGRYGDPLGPSADITAMSELCRVLAPHGHLLVVVPVGAPRLQFNGHRIYSFQMVCDGFAALRLREFSLIPDKGAIIRNADPHLVPQQKYGCGCFFFEKVDT